ncbi:fibronectin type III domain-containing protein [Kosakonia oryzae]|uniref:chitinase n=1 Tax=Kosakonia oryzae TaxID=497725 RepID=A0AA94H6H8_9ENTR|nr:glycosyl hydrolase family 18 protein [Kosakonia oryzae]ANI84982.1 chitinase [Kosakonia oryzae]UDJ82241.1 chitinase [Kosakonia oryzae]SFC98800.1 Chitinase [Kosakonia oryzae]
MKGIFKRNRICAGLALAGMVGFSGHLFAATDYADTMPSIEGKKVLVGYWHNWDQGFSGDYAQGYPLKMALKDTPKEYNVVMAAFMKSPGGAAMPTFVPYYGTDQSFREEIAALNERGQAVLLSLGGADAHIELHEANGDTENLANEIIRLVDVYGFDGLDLDLEQSAIKLADNETVIPAALKKVRAHYEQQGKHFIISMAPEIPYLTKANPQYQNYIERLDGYYDFIAPQYYNQGAFGIGFQPDDTSTDGWWVNYAQNDDAKKYEFLYHFSKEIITNKHGLSAVKIPSSKLVIGLPSNTSAAATGFVKTPEDVYRVFADMEKEGLPLRGLMTWSINWDEGDNVNHQSFNGQFRKAYTNLIHDGGEMPAPEEDTTAPSVPSDVQGTSTATSVQLNWKASTDDTGVHHYSVFRNQQKVADVNTTTFVDNNLQAETEYQYTIVAVDAANNASAASAVFKVKTQAAPAVDTEAPSIPTGMGTVEVTDSTIALQWKAATDNVHVTGYQLFRDGKLIASPTTSAYVDKGLQPETIYQYQVLSLDAAGNKSGMSEKLDVTTNAKVESAYPAYQENFPYAAGDIVTGTDGNAYQCKPWPYTSWCSGAAFAYAPGTGSAWDMAWDKVSK